MPSCHVNSPTENNHVIKAAQFLDGVLNHGGVVKEQQLPNDLLIQFRLFDKGFLSLIDGDDPCYYEITEEGIQEISRVLPTN